MLQSGNQRSAVTVGNQNARVAGRRYQNVGKPQCRQAVERNNRNKRGRRAPQNVTATVNNVMPSRTANRRVTQCMERGSGGINVKQTVW